MVLFHAYKNIQNIVFSITQSNTFSLKLQSILKMDKPMEIFFLLLLKLLLLSLGNQLFLSKKIKVMDRFNVSK